MALEKLSDVTVRESTVRVRVPWHDVQRLLGKAAVSHIGLSDVEIDRSIVKIELKQEERGSPSYAVGEWSAIATVTTSLD
ncbi:MAG TPA: hypothetical protein VHL34_25040 [Rhizomicrobium sp.]|jgi:hypothetical protein|nr:hypothetical protein [Rhizomicrobium sp.]